MDINALFDAAATPITQVTDLQSATAVAKELAELRAKVDAINEDYGEQMAAYRELMDAVQNECATKILPLLEEIEVRKEMLVDFHKREYANAEDKEKVKSIKLPHGVTLSSRSPQQSFEIKDKQAYMAFAERIGLVKTSTAVDWATMKKQLSVHEGKVIHETTGEVVEFIQVEEKERAFDVK